MAEIVNLRIARKRAARSKAERTPPNSGSPMARPIGARPYGGGPGEGPPNSRSASYRNRRPSMKSPVIKRSIVIAGHKTSVSLEDAFWKGLKDIADDRDVTLSDLVSSIDTDRQHGNLSSAIRLFVLDHYRNHTARARARGDARPDRDAGRYVSSASRVDSGRLRGRARRRRVVGPGHGARPRRRRYRDRRRQRRQPGRPLKFHMVALGRRRGRRALRNKRRL